MTSAAVVIGHADAVGRQAAYNSRVYWETYVEYMGQPIERAFWKNSSRSCSLYRARIGKVTLYALNLMAIRKEVARYLGAIE